MSPTKHTDPHTGHGYMGFGPKPAPSPPEPEPEPGPGPQPKTKKPEAKPQPPWAGPPEQVKPEAKPQPPWAGPPEQVKPETKPKRKKPELKPKAKMSELKRRKYAPPWAGPPVPEDRIVKKQEPVPTLIWREEDLKTLKEKSPELYKVFKEKGYHAYVKALGEEKDIFITKDKYVLSMKDVRSLDKVSPRAVDLIRDKGYEAYLAAVNRANRYNPKSPIKPITTYPLEPEFIREMKKSERREIMPEAKVRLLTGAKSSRRMPRMLR